MNKEEFQQTLNSTDKPIVADFWAPWCGPCKITKPILEKLGTEFSEQVEFLPINADHAPELIDQYRILGIPSVLAIRNGEEVARFVGAQGEAGYRAVFEALAAGEKLILPMSQINRILRLGSGALLLMYGFTNGNWLLVSIGGVIAFMGVYDRCPVWNALSRLFQRK